MNLWNCVVSEAWSSLAWWLQPRWVVEAPAQDQSRSWQGGNYLSRISSMKYLLWILCLRPTQLWAGSPETIHLESTCQDWFPLLFLGRSGKCENFSFFSVVSVMYCPSISFKSVSSFPGPCIFVKKGMRWPCLISWDLQNSMFMDISWNVITFLSNRSMIESPQGPDVHRQWNTW